jgi:hypothetical protein
MMYTHTLLCLPTTSQAVLDNNVFQAVRTLVLPSILHQMGFWAWTEVTCLKGGVNCAACDQMTKDLAADARAARER